MIIQRNGPIVKKTLAFANEIIQYCDVLSEKRKYIISNQLLKSGTSIGANVFAAQYSESREDFMHKMKIAQKEANETLYWPILTEKIQDSGIQNDLIGQLNEIMAILAKIIITIKKNLS